MTDNQAQADPAQCNIVVCRAPAGGRVECIAVTFPPEPGRPAAYEVWAEDGGVDRLIALAREEERTDPHSDKMPSDRALICAALRALGIPILGGGAAPLVVLTRVGGTQDDIDAAAMERALFPAALPEAAKAPLSLLAAAKAVVEWEARMGGFEAPVWDALRAAIAQAEGR